MSIDFRDLMLEAQAEVRAVVREVMLDLMKPQVMAQVRMMWAGAPDEVKEAFRREKPQDYAELMKDLEVQNG